MTLESRHGRTPPQATEEKPPIDRQGLIDGSNMAWVDFLRTCRYLPHIPRKQGVAYRNIEDTVLEAVDDYYARITSGRVHMENPWAYLEMTVKTKSKNQVEKERRISEIELDALDPEVSARISKDEINPEEIVIQYMEERRLRDTLEESLGVFFPVFWAHVVMSMSYQEISDQTGLPVGTISSRINRAKKILAKMPELLLQAA